MPSWAALHPLPKFPVPVSHWGHSEKMNLTRCFVRTKELIGMWAYVDPC